MFIYVVESAVQDKVLRGTHRCLVCVIIPVLPSGKPQLIRSTDDFGVPTESKQPIRCYAAMSAPEGATAKSLDRG